MLLFVLSLLVAVATREAVAAPAASQVFNLPGLSQQINFDQYSGYINVNEKEGRNIFYWFVESQNSPSTDPLILWLQGGPGCSGLFGLVSENGPFTLQNNGSLSINPYSWNTNANMLYIESPVGVGFSFTTDSFLTNSDNQTMQDSYAFLQQWFQLYPEYQTSDFYVAGESYGGHYVPQLSWTILENNANPSNLKINLQGMLIGNAWTDIFYDSWSVPPFVYFHSLCSYQTYELVVANCIDNSSLDLSEQFYDYKPRVLRAAAEDCGQALQQMYDEMGPINNYDIYTPCYGGLQDDCTDNTIINNYFNDEEVQTALHVDTSGKTNYTWTSCSDVNYTAAWRSILPLYPMLMDAIHVMVYSGDVTYNVPAIGTQTWVDDFNQPLEVPWTAWFLDDQVAGYYKKYQKITYATVLGSGHMVPMYTPAAAKELLNAYFNNTF